MNSFQAFFAFLLRSSFEATVIVGLILLIQVLLRRRLGARWHYALWLVLVARMFMPWTPESPASLFALLPQAAPPALMVGANNVFSTYPTEFLALQPDMPELVEVPADSNGPQPVKSQDRFAMLAVLWLIGAVIFSAYFLLVNLHFARRLRAEPVLHDAAFQALLGECCQQLRIRTSVKIVATSLVASPTLFGYVYPRILLPQHLVRSRNLAALRYVLLHELAHVKRHDILVTWLTTFLQALHWFNPFVWFAFYRMRLDREPACDALTLSCLKVEEACVYGNTLLDLVKVKQSLPIVRGTAGIMEHKTQIARRIGLIASHTARAYRLSPLVGVLFVLVVALTLTNAPTISAQPESVESTAPEQRPAPVEPVLQPDTDNAAELYLHALKLVIPVKDREGAEEQSEFSAFLKGPYDAALYDPVVARNDSALERMLQAAQMKKCDFAALEDASGLTQLLQDAGARDLFRVGTLAVARAISRDNGQRALDYYSAMMIMAERLHHDLGGALRQSLINNACVSMLQTRTVPLLRKLASTPERLEEMAELIRELRSTLGDWSPVAEREAALTASYFPAPRAVASYADLEAFQALANIRFTAPEVASGANPELSPLASLMRGENTAENREGAARQLGCPADALNTAQGIADAILEYGAQRSDLWRQIGGLLVLPYPEAISRLDALVAAQKSQDGAPGEPGDYDMGAHVLSTQADAQARLGLTQTAIAIVQYHASNGRLPDALTELEDTEIAMDPYSVESPFGYEVTGAKSFKLRSKGPTSSPSKNFSDRKPQTPMLAVSF